MQRLIGFFILLAMLALSVQAQAETRLALVVGNANYDAAAGGRLIKPTSDAQAIASALEATGFQVTLLLDTDENALEEAILDHQRRISSSGSDTVSFFYYAGHGATDSDNGLGGANYMIPVGATLRSPDDLRIRGVRLSDAIESFSRARISFVVFDACRNFPFARSSGRSLTRGFIPETEITGTFIAFSSAPRTVADDDSGYATALAEAITTPGKDHVDIFRAVRTEVYNQTRQRQIAWYRDGVLGDFFFATAAPPAPTPVVAPPAAPKPPGAEYLARGTALLEEGKTDVAVRELHMGCGTKNGDACYLAGMTHLEGVARIEGETPRPNYRSAYGVFERGCRWDHMKSCSNLAALIANGHGVPQDYSKAQVFYQKACEGDHGPACTGLGLIALNGLLGEPSVEAAKRHFSKGCNLGDEEACDRHLELVIE